jgi:Fe-S cluster biosynthesis and repair protein YggX
MKKIIIQNIHEIQNTMRRPNLRIIGINEKGGNISNLKDRKYLQQNYRRKFFQPKKIDAHENKRSLQNSK